MGEVAVETVNKPAYTLEQLREIVSQGMAISEAKMLLDEGYRPEDVLDLARLKAVQASQAAADAQTATAKAMQKAMRPENEFHPGISAFSHPEGDRAHPKAPMPYELYWNGYPVHKFPETETWHEWEAQRELRAGEFTVLRKDLTTMRVSVTAETDADGKPTKVLVSHPCPREDKDKIPPKTVLLYQMQHQDGNPRRRFVEAMNAYLETLA